MNAASVTADRHREVRLAARDWRAARIIDDDKVARIDRLYPDDRVRFGLVIRLVLFVFALVAIVAAFGLTSLVLRSGALLLILGGALWVANELLSGTFRLSGSGADEATSLASVVSLAAGIGWVATNSSAPRSSTLAVVIGLALLAFSVCAGWRFGTPMFGALAVVGLAVALTQAPAARLLCLAVPCILVPLLERLRRTGAAAPSQRDAATVASAALAALAYFAANLWSCDARTIEDLREATIHAPFLPHLLAAALTVLLPLAALAAGALRRDRLWLWLGCGMLAASGITLRHYMHIAPLWALLVGVGVTLSAVTLAIQRWLDTGPSGERSGFTARPLFEGRLQQSAELVAALATLAPAARALPAEGAAGGGDLKPGGGSFGGGGASDSF